MLDWETQAGTSMINSVNTADAEALALAQQQAQTQQATNEASALSIAIAHRRPALPVQHTFHQSAASSPVTVGYSYPPQPSQTQPTTTASPSQVSHPPPPGGVLYPPHPYAPQGYVASYPQYAFHTQQQQSAQAPPMQMYAFAYPHAMYPPPPTQTTQQPSQQPPQAHAQPQPLGQAATAFGQPPPQQMYYHPPQPQPHLYGIVPGQPALYPGYPIQMQMPMMQAPSVTPSMARSVPPPQYTHAQTVYPGSQSELSAVPATPVLPSSISTGQANKDNIAEAGSKRRDSGIDNAIDERQEAHRKRLVTDSSLFTPSHVTSLSPASTPTAASVLAAPSPSSLSATTLPASTSSTSSSLLSVSSASGSSSSGGGLSSPRPGPLRCRHICGCREMSRSLTWLRVRGHEKNPRVHAKCSPRFPCWELLSADKHQVLALAVLAEKREKKLQEGSTATRDSRYFKALFPNASSTSAATTTQTSPAVSAGIEQTSFNNGHSVSTPVSTTTSAAGSEANTPTSATSLPTETVSTVATAATPLSSASSSPPPLSAPLALQVHIESTGDALVQCRHKCGCQALLKKNESYDHESMPQLHPHCSVGGPCYALLNPNNKRHKQTHKPPTSATTTITSSSSAPASTAHVSSSSSAAASFAAPSKHT